MPAMMLLAAVRELAASNQDRDASAVAMVFGTASDRALGLAVQAGLREQLGDWVRAPCTARLRRQLNQAQVVLAEVERRVAQGNQTLEQMLGRPVACANPTDALVRLIQARAGAAAATAQVMSWLHLDYDASRHQAARLATHMQDLAAALLEFAGRADATDPRQVDWVPLVAQPDTIVPNCDAHASAIIGAACWVLAKHGGLRAWQLLAWRLWAMSGHEMAALMRPGRRWLPQLRSQLGRRPMGQILTDAGVVRWDTDNRCHRRPRADALATSLAILQGYRLDLQEAAQREMALPII